VSKNPNDKSNTPPYKQIDAVQLRKEAEKHGTSDPELHAKHERELAALDKAMRKQHHGR